MKGVRDVRFSKLLSMIMIICLLATVIAICPTASGAATKKHTITFDVQGIGETPDPITVNDGEKYLYLRDNDHGQNPTADGYVFHCWVTTLDFYPDEVEMSNTAAYLETPIHEDITLYAIWYKIVDHIEVEADPPIAGDVIGKDRYETPDFSFEYQSPRPTVRSLTEGVRIKDSFWSAIGPAAFWLADPNDPESTFKGTFASGKEYGVWMETEPLFGYEYADHLSITFNGKPLSSAHYADYNLCVVSAPITCVDQMPDADRLLGDVDGDSEIMITDAVYLQRKLVDMELPFAFCGAASDVDADRQITLMDATFIQRWLANVQPLEGIGEPYRKTEA